MPRLEAGEGGTSRGGARLSRRRLCFCWSFYDTQDYIRGVWLLALAGGSTTQGAPCGRNSLGLHEASNSDKNIRSQKLAAFTFCPTLYSSQRAPSHKISNMSRCPSESSRCPGSLIPLLLANQESGLPPPPKL